MATACRAWCLSPAQGPEGGGEKRAIFSREQAARPETVATPEVLTVTAGP